jgi:hypothetical protein
MIALAAMQEGAALHCPSARAQRSGVEGFRHVSFKLERWEHRLLANVPKFHRQDADATALGMTNE